MRDISGYQALSLFAAISWLSDGCFPLKISVKLRLSEVFHPWSLESHFVTFVIFLDCSVAQRSSGAVCCGGSGNVSRGTLTLFTPKWCGEHLFRFVPFVACASKSCPKVLSAKEEARITLLGGFEVNSSPGFVISAALLSLTECHALVSVCSYS